jgi:hypothetical protein
MKIDFEISQRIHKVLNDFHPDQFPENIGDTRKELEKIMQEYSNLVLQECIKEMEGLTNTSSGWDGYGIYCKAIEECISILTKRIEENK